jgi:glutamyl-tRNA synthetase
MTTTVRFAPSPTGHLHVGNGRTALLNKLFALKTGGRFVLRFDDTDRDRSREEYALSIEQDLSWLGLDWDDRVRQSDRLDRYGEAFARLRDQGRIYPCYETPEELEFKRRRLLARGKPPVYDRAALALSEQHRRTFEAEGRTPHWRFRLDDGEIAWTDLVRGAVRFLGERLSDPILVRGDGTFLYMLPSTVDDIDLAITHVIRGEDHVANTAIQIQIFRALGGTLPQFAHVPLLTDMTGKGLSKRLGSLTLKSLREAGIEALALDCFLGRLGTGDPFELRPDLTALAQDFDLARFGRATPKFDEAQLRHLNQRHVRTCPFADVARRLADLGLSAADPAFWEAVRPNLETIDEAARWYHVCYGQIETDVPDPDLAIAAASLLPEEPWTERTWEAWTHAVGQATGKRGKALYRPLRLALTGAEHGPELKALLPLIGRRRAKERLLSGQRPASEGTRSLNSVAG